VAILSFAPSLLISDGLVAIVVLDPLFVTPLIMALLLPLSFLLTPTLLFVVTSFFLVPGVSFSLISRNLLLGPLCASLVFCFGSGFRLFL
jgi:hypothetical protein